MLYAGAKELMRNTAEAGRLIEIDSAEEVGLHIRRTLPQEEAELRSYRPEAVGPRIHPAVPRKAGMRPLGAAVLGCNRSWAAGKGLVGDGVQKARMEEEEWTDRDRRKEPSWSDAV